MKRPVFYKVFPFFLSMASTDDLKLFALIRTAASPITSRNRAELTKTSGVISGEAIDNGNLSARQ
ncbi:MAG: hypothetical protein WDO19_28110 [Bacteroidota bacterium]